MPRTFGAVSDQIGAFELREVTRHGRPADRKFGRQFADAARTIRESKNQFASLGVAKSIESEIGESDSPSS
jgi:hypothetical protein